MENTESMIRKIMYILVGASGAGKTTGGIYIKEVWKVPEFTSTTTRDQREGELEGYSYYLRNKLQFYFTRKIEKSNYGGNLYCLSKKEVNRVFSKNDKGFVIADIHGVQQIKDYYKDDPSVEVVVIYFETTLELMEERMRERGDSEENIRKRLSKAIKDKELENGRYADYILSHKFSLEELYTAIANIINDED